MYDEIHCPFCGSTKIFEQEEDFNYEKGFWWGIFCGPVVGYLAGKYSDKRTEYYCQNCGRKFVVDW